jgi:hypothetical protein
MDLTCTQLNIVGVYPMNGLYSFAVKSDTAVPNVWHTHTNERRFNSSSTTRPDHQCNIKSLVSLYACLGLLVSTPARSSERRKLRKELL